MSRKCSDLNNLTLVFRLNDVQPIGCYTLHINQKKKKHEAHTTDATKYGWALQRGLIIKSLAELWASELGSNLPNSTSCGIPWFFLEENTIMQMKIVKF